jgi:hypothetical protein
MLVTARRAFIDMFQATACILVESVLAIKKEGQQSLVLLSIDFLCTYLSFSQNSLIDKAKGPSEAKTV